CGFRHSSSFLSALLLYRFSISMKNNSAESVFLPYHGPSSCLPFSWSSFLHSSRHGSFKILKILSGLPYAGKGIRPWHTFLKPMPAEFTTSSNTWCRQQESIFRNGGELL